MRIIARAAVVAALVAGSLLTVASPADAATINVGPGQSIQAAINKASPGDTINVAAGTYYESLLIRKDGIKLIGAGDNPSGTVLLPPASYSGFCSEEGHGFPGICVVAKKFDQNFNIVAPVNGVRVEGFLVRNFPGDGIVSFGANNMTLFNNTAAGNQGYGQTSFVGERNVFNRLVSRNNGAPGFYIGDTADADFVLMNSFSFGNDMGILVRNVNHGTLHNNVFQDNCVGIFVLHHGGPPDQTNRVQNWNIHDNQVLHNNKLCQDGENGGFGGVGVLMFGPKNVTVHNNTINGNQKPAGAVDGGAGVMLVNSKSDGGGPPVNNTVSNNTILNNKPYDVFYDGTGSGNTFPGNDCRTSKPAFICA